MIVRIDSKDLEDLIGRAYGKMSVRDMGVGDFELLARIRRTGSQGVHSREEADPGETREFDAVASDAMAGLQGDAAYLRERERITGRHPPPPTPGGERIAQPRDPPDTDDPKDTGRRERRG